VNPAVEILSELRERGVRVEARPGGKLYLTPTGNLTPQLIERVRQHKAQILSALTQPSEPASPPATAPVPPLPESSEAVLALAQLERLKGYTLPAGRIPAIREIAERMTGLTEPADIFLALQRLEDELIGQGGRFDPELAATFSDVERSFPDARLVDLRRRSS